MIHSATLHAFDGARSEFISDATEAWEAGAFCAPRDAEGLGELAALTARFERDALAIVGRLNIAASPQKPAYALASAVAEAVEPWLTASAARVYHAALALETEPMEAA